MKQKPPVIRRSLILSVATCLLAAQGVAPVASGHSRLTPLAIAARQAEPVLVGGVYDGPATYQFPAPICYPGQIFTTSLSGELTDGQDGSFTGSFQELRPFPWRIYDVIGQVDSAGRLSGTARIRLTEGHPADFPGYSATLDGLVNNDGSLHLVFEAPAIQIGFQTYCAVIFTLDVTNQLGDCEIDPSVEAFGVWSTDGGGNTVRIPVSSEDCKWRASLRSPVSWLDFTTVNGTGNGQISYSFGNFTGTGSECQSRTAQIDVRTRRTTRTITIIQASGDLGTDCACPTESVDKIASRRGDALDAARRFRDEVLERTERGREYTRLYYAFAGEVTAILEANPWLFVRAARLLDRHTPHLLARLDTGRVSISDADLEEVRVLLADVAASGSPGLRRAVDRVRRDLVSIEVQAEHGIAVRYADPSPSKQARSVGPLFTAFAGLGSLRPAEILAVAARGSAYARAARGHASEVATLLAANPRLALRAPVAFGRLTSLLESVVRSGGATLDVASRDELDAFLAGLEGPANPELRASIVLLRRDLGTPRALEGFGIRTPSRPIAGAAGTRRIAGSALDYATYFGGADSDTSFQIARDTAGNIYLTGWTSATDFPVTGGVQSSYGGGDSDAFVVKLDPTGSSVLFATYLGGSGQDIGTGLAVDAAGNVYVSGSTTSPNFPTASPLQATLRGERDAFLVKLSPSGAALTLSTYLGGTGHDNATGVAVSGKNVYLTGITSSADFPTVKARQRVLGGSTDAFVVKLKKGGAKIAYSTFYGGSGLEFSAGVAVDQTGSAYVAGVTSSADLPSARGTFGGLFDGFVAKLDAKGKALVYSTYLGGGDVDGVTGVAVDTSGNAYVSGVTASTDFPVANAPQPNYGGGLLDAFVAKVRADGSGLAYSTYLGGGDEDRAARIAIDLEGRATTTGLTASTDFPTRTALQGQLNGAEYDGFVTTLEASGASLAASTYLGGSDVDAGVSVAVGSDGTIYVGGETRSTDFPVVGPLQGTNGGGADVFLARLVGTTSVSSGPMRKTSSGSSGFIPQSLFAERTPSFAPGDAGARRHRAKN